jgi:hypothetical protein
MKRLDQRGAIDAWLIAFVATLLITLIALGFGIWAFSGRQEYKNKVDEKIAIAVVDAETANSLKKDAEFAEKEKNPLRTYTGPATYGSLSISYPKTWSAYVDETAKSNLPLSGVLNPSFVPGLQSNLPVALRFTVSSSNYSSVVKTFDSLVKAGKIKVTPYKADKVPNVIGVRLDGEILTGKQGSMIIVPLRDKTLQVWTESPQFVPDFNTIILPNLVFVP